MNCPKSYFQFLTECLVNFLRRFLQDLQKLDFKKLKKKSDSKKNFTALHHFKLPSTLTTNKSYYSIWHGMIDLD